MHGIYQSPKVAAGHCADEIFDCVAGATSVSAHNTTRGSFQQDHIILAIIRVQA